MRCLIVCKSLARVRYWKECFGNFVETLSVSSIQPEGVDFTKFDFVLLHESDEELLWEFSDGVKVGKQKISYKKGFVFTTDGVVASRPGLLPIRRVVSDSSFQISPNDAQEIIAFVTGDRLVIPNCCQAQDQMCLIGLKTVLDAFVHLGLALGKFESDSVNLVLRASQVAPRNPVAGFSTAPKRYVGLWCSLTKLSKWKTLFEYITEDQMLKEIDELLADSHTRQTREFVAKLFAEQEEELDPNELVCIWAELRGARNGR